MNGSNAPTWWSSLNPRPSFCFPMKTRSANTSSRVLAATGLYGVLAYLVTQRTGEIGIRIALGARRESVLGLMLIDGLRPALVGLALGLAGSAAVVRLISSMLYETSPLDPAVFAAV